MIKHEYENGKVQPPKLRTAQTSYDIERVKEKIEEEERKLLKFDMKYARKLPDFDSIEAPVRMNTAAIVREGNQLKKRKNEELNVIKEFEMNMRDASEFQRWSKEMEEKEEIERLEHMQKK